MKWRVTITRPGREPVERVAHGTYPGDAALVALSSLLTSAQARAANAPDLADLTIRVRGLGKSE